jgi:hypothetical protein
LVLVSNQSSQKFGVILKQFRSLGRRRNLKLTEEEKRGVKGAWMSGEKEAEQLPQAVGKLF